MAIPIAVSLALLAACDSGQRDPDAVSSAPVTPPARGTPLEVSIQIPRQDAAEPVATRLAEGLAAPTNRWFSGLAFGDQPMAVFPSPLSFAWQESGFAVGLPTITASENTIFGSMAADLTVDLGADAMLVSGYDDASVTITAMAAGDPVADVRIAQGWPAVSVTAASDDLVISLPLEQVEEGVWQVSGSERWGVAAPGATLDGATLRLPAGQSAILVAAPEGVPVLEAAAAVGSGLGEVSASAGLSAEEVTTTIEYAETDTLLVPPATVVSGCDGPGYATLYGLAPSCTGTSLSWSFPRTEAVASLDVSSLSEAELAEISDLVPKDVAALTDPSAWPGDSYFGTKALYRAAVLADVAAAVGDEESAATMHAALVEQLRLWTQPEGCLDRNERCVVLDTRIGGYIGRAPSFGSDGYNDHHFHYGYLIYAAAIAVRNDPTLEAELAPVVHAYIADIASPVSTETVPRNRTFDPYWGHPWASGYSPFADGNNQESISEAMMAWSGVALWAQATGQQGLADNATWMLSAETEAARTQWLAPQHLPQGYPHSIVSLVWGGKLDYATWFSDAPTAKLGILLIPMSPTMAQLGIEPEQITASVAEAMPGGASGPLADYVVMYSALASEAAADEAVETLRQWPQNELDDGLTRSYAMAWVMIARAAHG